MVLVRRIFRLYGAYRRQTCDIFFATVLALIRNSSILKRHLLIFFRFAKSHEGSSVSANTKRKNAEFTYYRVFQKHGVFLISKTKKRNKIQRSKEL